MVAAPCLRRPNRGVVGKGRPDLAVPEDLLDIGVRVGPLIEHWITSVNVV